MKSNVGSIDRIIRIILGLAVGVIGIYFKSWWGLVGVVLIVTALIQWCPVYWPLGISTKKAEVK